MFWKPDAADPAVSGLHKRNPRIGYPVAGFFMRQGWVFGINDFCVLAPTISEGLEFVDRWKALRVRNSFRLHEIRAQSSVILLALTNF